MDSQIISFLSIGIVGTAISYFIKAVKEYSYLKGVDTKIVALCLSLVLGGTLYLIIGTPLFTTIVGILMASQTVYAFVIKKE